MDIQFVKINPTQNMTILVESTHDRADYIDIACKLMDYANVYAEQVGFIEKSGDPNAVTRLHMMGGEFCGNATMSLASYYVWKKNLPKGTTEKVILESSGAQGVLACNVTVGENSLRSTVAMPKPEGITSGYVLAGCSAVKVAIPGINHYIVDQNILKESVESFANKAADSLIGTETGDAFGIMFWDKNKNYISPLVYVKDTNSKVWERGCGSGSAAVGAYIISHNNGMEKVVISQPGGDITVYVNDKGEVTIEGTIKIVATGTAYI